MEQKSEKPIVAIVGRPNVGKSTFFNRLIGKRQSIESEIPGTTRDRIYVNTSWCGKGFSLIDTAGMFNDSDYNSFALLTQESVEVAISQSDIIIFIIDVQEIIAADRQIAKHLRQSKNKVFLVANKADNQDREIADREIFSLGFGQPHFISAISGRGVADFLDDLTALFPKKASSIITDSDTIDVALIGRPNVGKSTLLNSLVDEKKSIVSSRPGTTRDTTDAEIKYKNRTIKFIDTAGIRRRGKIDFGIEKFAIIRAKKAIEQSEVVIILIDATEGITNQDAHIIGFAKELGKSIIIAVNKFDLLAEESDENIEDKMAAILGKMQNDLAFLPYSPVIFISAKEKENLNVLFRKIVEVHKERFINIESDLIKKIIFKATEKNPQIPKIVDFYQERANPIVFKLVCRNKKDFHFSHLRYLENTIRDTFPFVGTPIFIDLIDKKMPK